MPWKTSLVCDALLAAIEKKSKTYDNGTPRQRAYSVRKS